MKTTRIQLTVKQREILQPLFDEGDAYNILGESGSVLLQAWPSGKTGHADAVFLYPDQASAVKKVLGTDRLRPEDSLTVSPFMMSAIDDIMDDDIPF